MGMLSVFAATRMVQGAATLTSFALGHALYLIEFAQGSIRNLPSNYFDLAI